MWLLLCFNFCFCVFCVGGMLGNKRGFGDLEDDEDDIFSNKKVSFCII